MGWTSGSTHNSQIANPPNRIAPIITAVSAVTLAASAAIFARSSLRSHGYFDPVPLPASNPVSSDGDFSLLDSLESDTPLPRDNGLRNGINLLTQADAYRTFLDHGVRTTIPRRSLPTSLAHFIAAQEGSEKIFLPIHLKASDIYSAESNDPFSTFSTSHYVAVAELLDTDQLGKFLSGEFSLQVRSVSPQDFSSIHGGHCNCGYRAHEDHLKIITKEFAKHLSPGESVLMTYPDAGYSQVAQLDRPLPGDAWAIVTIKFAEK